MHLRLVAPEAGVPSGPVAVLPATAVAVRSVGGQTLRLEPVPTSEPPPDAILAAYTLARGVPRVLAFFAPHSAMLVNGRQPPRALVLQEGDHLVFPSGLACSLAAYYRPWIGEADQAIAGQPCLFCGLPLSGRVYRCACCGGGLHLANANPKDEQALNCALAVATCRACQRTVRLTEGYDTDLEAGL